MTTNTFTVPIALSRTRSAVLTLPWFVQRTEYNPAEATFEALVNGEEAFGAIYDAIQAAQRSVDIICWGFQPSMYFKRGANGNGSVAIGQLLESKGKQGVKVRLLCWGGATHPAQLMENMNPGDNLASLWPDTRNSMQRSFDLTWYARAELNNVTQWSAREGPDLAIHPQQDKLYRWLERNKAFPNIEFATRDFSLTDRVEIAWRTLWYGKDDTRSHTTKLGNSATLGFFPSHHQKMVLIDYELSGREVGFVMGHNMLDEYWDTNEHRNVCLHPQAGRNGRHPRQDISCRVNGPILRYLNANFCQAWDEATGQATGAQRAATALALRRDIDSPVMAQILRTQSQHGKGGTHDIETMYLQAVNNATNFIYIENQYFRFPPLAQKIRDAAQKQVKHGRDPGEHGSVHLFVVTNASDDAIGSGTLSTYRMLDALGRADTMPEIGKLERSEALQQQLVNALKERAYAASAVNDIQFARILGYSREKDQTWAEAKAQLREAQVKLAELERRKENPPATIIPDEIPGLKVHVCTLVAPDTPPGEPWVRTYVHAKLMIVDDVFTTLGSANLNTRSMEGDSELNICHENEVATRPLREKLWGIHTKGLGVGKNGPNVNRLDAGEVFNKWRYIIDKNKKRQASSKPDSPYAPLIEFRYDGTKRSRLD